MTEGKQKRGFACVAPERLREIAGKGGRAAHAKGTAHRFTSEEARAAGAKGGQKVSENREHMRKIGRRGGLAKKLQALAKKLQACLTPRTVVG